MKENQVEKLIMIITTGFILLMPTQQVFGVSAPAMSQKVTVQSPTMPVAVPGSTGAITPALEWEKNFGGGEKNIELYDMKQTKDNGFIAAGSATYNIVQENRTITRNVVCVIKTDDHGVKQWDKYLGSSEASAGNYAECIQELKDGGYILAGRYYPQDNQGNSTAYLAKLDAQGNAVWEKNYMYHPVNQNSQATAAKSIRECADGGFIIAGYTNAWDEDEDSSATEYMPGSYAAFESGSTLYNAVLVKTDSSGTVDWIKAYDFLCAEDALEISNGTYVVLGNKNESNGIPDVFNSGECGKVSRIYLACIGDQGAIRWNKEFEPFTVFLDVEKNNTNNFAYDIQKTTDGGYIILADENTNTGNHSLVILKIDQNGGQQWIRTIEADSLTANKYQIQQCSDGGFIISDGKNLMRIDISGGVMWKQTLNNDANEVCSIYAVTQTSDLGYAAAGHKKAANSGNDNYQALLMKFVGSQAGQENQESAVNVSGNISLTIGNSKMTVNGKLLEIDPGKGTKPELKYSSICLPIKAVAEAMGAKVDWDNAQRKVTLTKGRTKVEIWVGKKTVRVNGKEQTIDTAPYTTKTGRTMVPLRFAGESLGGEVKWNSKTNTANILFNSEKQITEPATESTTEQTTSSAQTPKSWAGTWFTNWGKMELEQTGTNIRGTYGNNYTIKGIVSGKVFTGTYDEDGSTGGMKFVLADDGLSFTGTYDGKCEWNGKREKSEHDDENLSDSSQEIDWSGTWNTNWGTLVIKQNGNNVTGTYDYQKNCSITGKVEKNKLSGTYIEGNDEEDAIKGLFEFYMQEGNKSFKGCFGDSKTARQDWAEWNGSK